MKKLLATVVLGASMLAGASANSMAATHKVVSCNGSSLVIPGTKTEPTVPVAQVKNVDNVDSATAANTSGQAVHWEYQQVPIYDNFGFIVGYRTVSVWVNDPPIWVPIYPRY